MITAVIFDRDGVLTQFDTPAATSFFAALLPISVEELSMRWQQWGDKVGFPASVTQEEQFWHGFWENLSDDLQLPPAIRTRLHQIDYTYFMQPYADARTALLTARQQGLRIGVLSNFTLASLDASLKAVGLANLVDIAYAAPVIGASKPQAAAYLAVTEALAVSPEECLFFDDETDCVAGARALNMRAYLVDRSRNQHDLAGGVVCDLTALPNLLP